MKKSALLTAAQLLVSSSYAMAAPINQMANHGCRRWHEGELHRAQSDE